MRRIEVVPFARRNLDAYLKQLNESEPEAWPKFLSRAWTIIAKDLGEPHVAKTTVVAAVTAAHTCAADFFKRTLANERNRTRREFLAAVSKLQKPIERRAPIRRALDEVAQREFRDGHADLEVMSNFFNGCADVARGFPRVPDAQRMMRALGEPTNEIETTDESTEPPTRNILNQYEAMHPAERGVVEESLQKLIKDRSASFSTLDVLSTVAHSLTISTIIEMREYSGDLLRAYLARVADIWRQSRLRPIRRRKHERPDYKSDFHRFLELVLIDQLDPGSRLFDPLDEKELMRNREFLASLPLDRDERQEAGIGPRSEWLISDEDLKALTAPD